AVDAVDDDHGGVVADGVHQAHVGEAVVDPAVAVEVVRLAEEDEVAGDGPAALVDAALALGVAVDGGDAVVAALGGGEEVDARGPVRGEGERGAVVAVLPPVEGDGAGA